MREIQLTKGLVAIVDDEDYEIVSVFKWHAQGRPGEEYAVYGRRLQDKKRFFRMHHLIMRRILGGAIPDGVMVDHIDGDRMNNTRSNLRLVTRHQNAHNMRQRSNGVSSRYKGVGRHKNRWQARGSPHSDQ